MVAQFQKPYFLGSGLTYPKVLQSQALPDLYKSPMRTHVVSIKLSCQLSEFLDCLKRVNVYKFIMFSSKLQFHSTIHTEFIAIILAYPYISGGSRKSPREALSIKGLANLTYLNFQKHPGLRPLFFHLGPFLNFHFFRQ